MPAYKTAATPYSVVMNIVAGIVTGGQSLARYIRWGKNPDDRGKPEHEAANPDAQISESERKTALAQLVARLRRNKPLQ
jgi:hypothetical protein